MLKRLVRVQVAFLIIMLDHPVETCLAPSMILGAVILEGKKDEISVKNY